ncbi:MAG TPA: substrate-binding domain-containing protein, partial [Myxococcaceae bacterium]|nr:substrate-binding domain-containing protein [Myxococcaceae bacterium]
MRLTNGLKRARLDRELTQQELAERVGISRQSLNALEAGRVVPGTDVALGLARELGRRVEALFSLEDGPSVDAVFAGKAPGEGGRLALAEVDGHWVARALGPGDPAAADGLLRRGQVRPLGSLDRARKRLVVMGCAPVLGVLASRLGEDAALPMSWVRGSSGAAMNALARREVHVAGIHLRDGVTGSQNVLEVQRRFPEQPMLVVNLVTWEQGIVAAPGNPRRLRKAADLLRPGLRLVRREADSGAEKLLADAVNRRSGRLAPAAPGEIAAGHFEVAQRVALGVADAGIAIRAAALAFELPFIPLAEERFDLVIPQRLATDARIERLVDTLS